DGPAQHEGGFGVPHARGSARVPGDGGTGGRPGRALSGPRETRPPRPRTRGSPPMKHTSAATTRTLPTRARLDPTNALLSRGEVIASPETRPEDPIQELLRAGGLGRGDLAPA